MITGKSFRDAREASKRTQQDLADALGVALRTIGNWERSGVVPRKYWLDVEKALPASVREYAMPQPNPGAQPTEDRIVRDLETSLARVFAKRDAGVPLQDIADEQRSIYNGAVEALNFAEASIAAGVSALATMKLAKAIVDVCVDAGTIGFTSGVQGFDPLGEILHRANELATLAAEQEDERNRFRPKVKSVVGPSEDELASMDLGNLEAQAAGDDRTTDSEDDSTP